MLLLPLAAGLPDIPRQKRTRHMSRTSSGLAPHSAGPYGYGPPAADGGPDPQLCSWRLVEAGNQLEVTLVIDGRLFRGRLGNIAGSGIKEEELGLAQVGGLVVVVVVLCVVVSSAHACMLLGASCMHAAAVLVLLLLLFLTRAVGNEALLLL